MHKILVLWATPRSTSTAFEWMMRMRGDMVCFHEPFGEPWYQGETPLWPRIKPDSPRIPGLTFESVWENLCTNAQSEPVFIKDFPHYVRHMWDDVFLSSFNHSFLIRDPAKSITSIFRHWPNFDLEEVGIIEQRQLFDQLTDKTGSVPPVIDSDDLLANPHGLVEAYCRALNIPFKPEALNWTPGNRKEVSWYDRGSWHANLKGSDGLKPQPRKNIDISQVPDKVKCIYATCRPHYEHLYRHRIISSE